LAEWLKRRAHAPSSALVDQQISDTVSRILSDVEHRGNQAVRELAVKFDNLDRESYLLSQSEIESCIADLSHENVSDIQFAQAQVFTARNSCSFQSIERMFQALA
jgi:sulfopropanediol 3-dehydrogenase